MLLLVHVLLYHLGLIGLWVLSLCSEHECVTLYMCREEPFPLVGLYFHSKMFQMISVCSSISNLAIAIPHCFIFCFKSFPDPKPQSYPHPTPSPSKGSFLFRPRLYFKMVKGE